MTKNDVPKHGFVLAQQPHAWHWNVRVGQRGHDTVFALHLMGSGQQLAWRLLAKYVVATGSAQVIRGVALSPLKLTNLQLAVEARQPSAQVPGQSGLVEAVCRQHRYQLCHPLHSLPLRFVSLSVRPTAVAETLVLARFLDGGDDPRRTLTQDIAEC